MTVTNEQLKTLDVLFQKAKKKYEKDGISFSMYSDHATVLKNVTKFTIPPINMIENEMPHFDTEKDAFFFLVKCFKNYVN